jgi:hypothetical protein
MIIILLVEDAIPFSFLLVALWIGGFLSILTVEAENVSRVGVRGVSRIGPFPFAGLISFGGLLLV